MIRKWLQIGLALILLFQNLAPVQASTAEQCRTQVSKALDSTIKGGSGVVGYIPQLENLTSTSIPTHLLIEEVQQLARDAWLETKGICAEVQKFESINDFYVNVYELQSCKELETTDASIRAEIYQKCIESADHLTNDFLDSLRQYLLKQAIRTSIEPIVQRMRSLNERLVVLVTEYSRLVNNFYTFSFRLGDTIIGERD